MMARQLLFALLLILTGSTVIAEPNTTDFNALLAEGNLQFEIPEGFTETSADHAAFGRGKSLKSSDEQLEVHYQVMPLSRIQIDYEDPHNSAPHPNHLFDMLFRSHLQSLAKGGIFNSKAYSPDNAQTLFNAGWAAVAVFDVSPEISNGYSQGMLLAIHQDDAADAYVLFLTNDLQTSRTLINNASSALRFKSIPDQPKNH